MAFSIFLITLSVVILGGSIIAAIYCYLLYKQYVRKLDIALMDVTNKKYELYCKLDPELLENEIDKFINGKISAYVKYNFIINRILYITSAEIDKMNKEIIKQVMIELPDLYLFYIRNLININNDEDLLKYITRKSRELCLNVVTEYNKPIDG